MRSINSTSGLLVLPTPFLLLSIRSEQRLQQPSSLLRKNSTMVAISADQPTSTPFSLQILLDTTTSRAAHGLKHGDYLRYRRYCTRRLARLRAATHLSNKTSSNPPRYAPSSLTQEAIQSNPRALSIPLVLSERAWAHAMDVKTQQPAGPARARRVMLAKLRRANGHATELANLCKVVGDEDTVLEAEAYSRSMAAVLALEEEKWAASLAAYQTVHDIYTGMAGVRAGTSGAGLYERRLEEVKQAIRFCNYHLERSEEGQEESLEAMRGGDDALAEKIEMALVEARKRAAVTFGEVTWCGVTVPLRAEKVREAVLMAEEEGRVFEGGKVEDFDKLFMTYHDAVKVVADELADFRKSGAAEERIRELELLVAYLTYNRLQYTVQRNLLLIESFRAKRGTKPDDFVRLYDNLISNLTDVLGLPGVDTDAEVSNETESRRKLFRAYRCYHLAQCYLAAQLQSEAAVLFDRVSAHAASLTGKYANEAAEIVAESTGLKSRAKAQVFLNVHTVLDGMDGIAISGKEERVLRKQRLVDHLDTIQSFAERSNQSKVICEMPPALEAVPCKPVLFDLAIDGIRFPEDEEKFEKEEEPPAVEKVDQAASTTFQPLASTRFGRWWSGRS